MKKIPYILLVSILLLVVACNRKQDTIAIYLLKERMPQTKGVPFLETELANKLLPEERSMFAHTYFLEADSSLVYAGEFVAAQKDLQQTPLIANDEIIGFYAQTNALQLSTLGNAKMHAIQSDLRDGRQFAICVNDSIVFTGYFMNSDSSYPPSWNYIVYSPDVDTKSDGVYTIERNDIFQDYHPYLPDMQNYPKLLNAFSETNRLKDE